jgi:exopolysaccharide biosynthesis protein
MFKIIKWPMIAGIILIGSGAFVLVDTFILPHAGDVTYIIQDTGSSIIKNTSQDEDSAASETTATAATGNTAGGSTENALAADDTPTVSNADSTLSKGSSGTESNTDDSIDNTAENTDESAADNGAADAPASLQIVMSDGYYSYEDESIQIEINRVESNNTVYYVADIQLEDPSLLKTALAQDTFGTNITAATSVIAANHQAIFAVNGDYYGFRDDGVVMRNGQLLRTTPSDSTSGDALLIDAVGNMQIISETAIDFDSLASDGIRQILSFGPALVIDGEVVASNTRNSNRDNPRTAVGQMDEGHYVFIVVDGRTQTSQGMTTDELAQVFKDLGCTVAYNLDGGGSSTMYFNGEVINNPTDGKRQGERSVSDIVYIGY